VSRFPADNPAHRRIVAQALGVVHVLISSKAAEYRLPQQADQRMAAVPAGSRISECLARHLGQTECIVEFAVCQQSRVRRDRGLLSRQVTRGALGPWRKVGDLIIFTNPDPRRAGGYPEGPRAVPIGFKECLRRSQQPWPRM
jgi:hypothetical protein